MLCIIFCRYYTVYRYTNILYYNHLKLNKSNRKNIKYFTKIVYYFMRCD